VHILVATDAQWVLDDVVAALGTSSTTFDVVADGRLVAGRVAERLPDIAVLDLQVGSMGGMAVTMDLRLDHSSGAVPHVPVLMLLDRDADVHLARRSGADGWVVKPLEPLLLRRAVESILAGQGWPVPAGEPHPGGSAQSGEGADAETADNLL
jgi:DNA-binding response OmpR family regulator